MIIVGRTNVPSQFRRWFYTFDDVDDRITIPTVNLEIGDTVEFAFTAPETSGNIGFFSPTTGRSMFYQLGSEYIISDADVLIDGNVVLDHDVALSDGQIHHVKITATQPNSVTYIGDYFGAGDFWARCPIWDFKLSTAQGLLVNYPIDDGPSSQSLIRNSIGHGYNTNGSVAYDENGFVFLDYANDVDPKYGNVAPTMQEAIARCREGTLGKNFDFRFGVADWEGETNANFSVTDGVMTLNANNDADSWTYNRYFLHPPLDINYLMVVTFSCSVAGQGIEIGLKPRGGVGGITTLFQSASPDTERTVSVIIDGTGTNDLYIRNTQRDGLTPPHIHRIEIRPETSRIVTEPVFYMGISENFNRANWHKK